MGITGTTAKEAAGTVQGSAGSMKAAWQNLVTTIANPNKRENLGAVITDFTTSARVSLENIMPVVTQAVSGVGTLVQELAPIIAEEIPNLVTTTLPTLLTAGTQLVGGIAAGLGKAIPELAPEVKKLAVSIATGIRDNAGTVITGFSHVLRQSVTWLGKNLPAMIDMGKQIVSAIAKGFGDNAEEILSSLSDLGVILFDNVIKPAWDFVIYELPDYINAGLRTIDFVGIGEDMSNLVIEGLKGIADFVSAIDWEQVGTDIAHFINGIDWKGIIEGVFNLIGSIIKSTPKLIEGVVKSIDFDSAIDIATILFIPKLLGSFATAISSSEKWKDIKGALSGKFGEAGEDLEQKEVSGWGIAGKLKTGFMAFILGWQIGKWIYARWGEQIDKVLYQFYDKFVDWGKSVKKVFDDTLGYYYNNGSKLFDELHPSANKNDTVHSARNEKGYNDLRNVVNDIMNEEGSYENVIKNNRLSDVLRVYTPIYESKDAYDNPEAAVKGHIESIVKEWISTNGTIADTVALQKNGVYFGSPISQALNRFVNKVQSTVDAVSEQKAQNNVLEQLKANKFNLAQHALGGIVVNRPVLTTSGDLFGEAGREAILPLDSHTGWMDELSSKISRNVQPVVNNHVDEISVNFPEGLTIGSDYDTERMVERLSEKLEQLSTYQHNSVGLVNW